MAIVNSESVEAWLFEHAQTLGHACTGVKGVVHGESANIAWIAETTGETIDIIYE